MQNTEIPFCAAPLLPRPPSFTLPVGACDCHAHVFGPASHYPYHPNRTYTPPDASARDYANMLKTLGFSRAVLVQPSVYGTDNRLLLDTLREAAHDTGPLAAAGINLRGVAVVSSTISEEEIQNMHDLGVRGIRMNLLYKGGVDMDTIYALARRIADYGWHIQFLVDITDFEDLDAVMEALPTPSVIDHMGHMPAHIGAEHPRFRSLLSLVEKGKTWVKLSGSYRFTAQTQVPFSDVTPFAKALVAADPTRMVYGTDWPHPFVHIPMPNDGHLLDQLLIWAPDAATRHKILVENPARLYGF